MASRPNILLIYTDQQRYDTIGALGNSVIQTPNLDRLVSEGVTFTHATTPSPVCMPARWSLNSGQWTTTHQCYSNHDPGTRPPADLPGMLRAAGYRTGLAGKNHSFLTEDDFDYWAENPQPTYSPAWPEVERWSAKRKLEFPRLAMEPIPGGLDENPEHATTNAGLEFMQECIAENAPFFMFLSYLYPHPPFEAPEPFYSMYANSPLPEPVVEPDGLSAAGKPFRHIFKQRNDRTFLDFPPEKIRLLRQVYYGMVSLVDAEIGRVLHFLDEQGLTENTLLVFTSDHGDYLGDHGMITKSPAMYDCLVRVPFIVRWPGQIDSDRRDTRFVSHIDLMPTLAEATGADCPPQAQGMSFMPLLTDNAAKVPFRAAAFSEYGVPGVPYDEERLQAEGLDQKHFANPNNPRLPWEANPVSLAGRIYMIRTHKWKYVDEPDGTCELYDLKNDPHELVNLCNDPAYAEIQQKLSHQLAVWQQQITASTPGSH